MDYTELVNALNAADKRPCSDLDCPGSGECPTVGCLFREAADAIASLVDEVDHFQAECKNWYLAYMSTLPGRWLSVEEVLPGAEQVLINLHYPDGSNEVSLGEHWNCPDIPEEDGWGGFGGNGVVTHWMPLPTPPKEET